MKDFEDFLAYADANEDACQKAAERALAGSSDYFNEDGTFIPDNILNAAYVTSRASMLELIRQYHDWACS